MSLLLATLALTLFQAPAQTADDFLKAIQAVKEPPYPGGTDADVAKWEAECDKVADKQGELIWQFYEKYPAHTETASWLYNRWEGFSGHRMPPELNRIDRIEKDVNAFLSKPQLEQNKAAGMVWRTRSTMFREWRTMITDKVNAKDEAAKPYLTRALAACDAFYKQFPKEQKGVFQYYNFSQMSRGTEFEMTALSRMVNQYPEHRLAKSSKGRLHAMTMIGKPFELAFKDVLTEKQIDMKDYRGKVVLLDFWATWCAPCKVQIESELLDMAKRLEPKGLAIIGISVDVPEDSGGKKMLLDYIKEKGITWPNYYLGKKPEDSLPGEWGVSGYPRQFLIDRKGNLRYIDTSKNRDEIIEKLLTESA